MLAPIQSTSAARLHGWQGQVSLHQPHHVSMEVTGWVTPAALTWLMQSRMMGSAAAAPWRVRTSEPHASRKMDSGYSLAFRMPAAMEAALTAGSLSSQMMAMTFTPRLWAAAKVYPGR